MLLLIFNLSIGNLGRVTSQGELFQALFPLGRVVGLNDNMLAAPVLEHLH